MLIFMSLDEHTEELCLDDPEDRLGTDGFRVLALAACVSSVLVPEATASVEDFPLMLDDVLAVFCRSSMLGDWQSLRSFWMSTLGTSRWMPRILLGELEAMPLSSDSSSA